MHVKFVIPVFAVLSFLLFIKGVNGGDIPRTKAPELFVSEWINKDIGTLRDLRDKVIIINFFQMTCPESGNFAIPLILKWEEKYKDRKDIHFVSLLTVTEDHKLQTPAALKAFIKLRGINHSVGIDNFSIGYYLPVTMRKYRTGGTPCIAIIDKEGNMHFQHKGVFEVEPVEKLIDHLLNSDVISYR